MKRQNFEFIVFEDIRNCWAELSKNRKKKKKDFRNLWWDLFEYPYEYWDTHMSRAYSTPDEGRSTGRELKDKQFPDKTGSYSSSHQATQQMCFSSKQP